MLPSRRKDQITCFLGLRNLTSDPLHTLDLKYKTLMRRYNMACKMLALPVDPSPGGLSMVNAHCDPALLREAAVDTLQQVRKAAGSLEKSFQQQLDLLSVNQELLALAQELASYQDMDAMDQALFSKQITDKQSRKQKLKKKAEKLKTNLRLSEVEP